MLNQKRRRLAQIDYDLAIDTKLLAGPIYKKIYKLVIHGDVMLRPMLCRGPVNNDQEYTFLIGATERDWKLSTGSKEQADQRRAIVLNNPLRRTPYERIS